MFHKDAEMNLKTTKFGGTSLSDAAQFRKCADIIKAEEARRYVVVSAPGKRSADDTKVTDMLIACSEKKDKAAAEDILSRIQSRYKVLVRSLGVEIDVDREFEKISAALGKPENADYIVSRGEYMNARIMAAFTGYDFVDAEGTIWFDGDGMYDEERTKAALGEVLAKSAKAVIPGFYGCTPDGKIKTFSRGGSDITGAIVAAVTGADVYENWTDVSGFLMADPRIVDNPLSVPVITYKELRELSYMGAAVLHEETVFPVVKLGIPINIRNTNCPDDAGTLIVQNADYFQSTLEITGISGKKNNTIISIEKDRLNEVAQLRTEILAIFSEYNITIKNMLSGIDSLTIVAPEEQVKACEAELEEELRERIQPASLSFDHDIAMIAIVGRELSSSPAVAVKVLGALSKRKINIRLIDHGAAKISMLIGVDGTNYVPAIEAIYTEFAKK
ncbi:MAG: aspartate kinase [Firmicutes bacterium]|nr:aspartate kinase [Bacillota bacterium]